MNKHDDRDRRYNQGMTGKCAKEIEEKMEIPSCFKGLKPG
jgi:hypothetical protein